MSQGFKIHPTHQNYLKFTFDGLFIPNIYLYIIYYLLIQPTHQKYLKFTFDDLFQFTCMPDGCGPALRVFTKISKVLSKSGSQLCCACR